MKKLIFALLLISPFYASSQSLKKVFLTILDEYIDHEPERIGMDKDGIVIYTVFDEFNKGFAISLTMYELEYYPNVDSMKTYNGVHMLVRYPRELSKKLDKHFKPINDSRIVIDEGELKTMRESASNFTFQVNEKKEIYIMLTSDEDYYIERLKKRSLKFSEDFNRFNY